MKSFTKSALKIITIAFVMLPQLVSAAEKIEGDWEFKFKDKISHGKPSSGSLTIIKNADGKYEGKLLTQSGESTLSDIKFQNGKLSFVQTSIIYDRKMKTIYTATVQGTKLSGKGLGPLGRYGIEGSLQEKPKNGADAIVGKWQIDITIPPIIEKITFFKNPDGSLAAQWHEEGKAFKRVISDVNCIDTKLTFIYSVKSSSNDLTYFFEGTVKGDTIKGVLKGKDGNSETTASRVAPTKSDEGKKT